MTPHPHWRVEIHKWGFGVGIRSWGWQAKCWVAAVVSDSVMLWIAARQAPVSTGFSRQEYWSGLPCPPPGGLPRDHTRVSDVSCAGRQVLYHKHHLGSPHESGALMNRISALIKEAWQSSFALLAHEDTESVTGWRTPTKIQLCVATLTLDFQPPALWATHFFCL